MKAIIYAGIGLFSVATVYGVADYYSSKKNGELKKLYVEEKLPTVIPAADEKTTEVTSLKEVKATPVENKPVKVVKTKSLKKVRKAEKKFRLENFSRARIPEPIVIEAPIPEKKN